MPGLIKHLVTILILSITVTISSCDSDGDTGGPTITFERTYGNIHTSEYGTSARQTSDGGYILFGGYTSKTGERDLYLVKTDQNGDEMWAKPFGSSGTIEFGYCVQQTSDNGYIMIGNYHSDSIRYNMYLVKSDPSGNVEWTKTFGGIDSYEYGYSVQQTSDGGYILFGHASDPGPDYGDMYLVKTGSNGEEQWSKTFGGTVYESLETGRSVRETSDGGYILLGFQNDCYACYHSDMYLVKTDKNGNKIWSKTFDSNSSNEHGQSVRETSDGGYILLGSGYNGMYLVKTDSDGNREWSSTFSGIKGSAYGQSVCEASDGGYILLGRTESYMYLVKTDSNGKEQWSKTFGGSDSDEIPGSVCETTDGGFILFGSTYSTTPGHVDFYLVKTDANGDLNTLSGE
jgi:hypothetical protein